VDEHDLFGIYIEENPPTSNHLDMRAGRWIPECAEQLKALARKCTSKYGKRIATMIAVMRRLVERAGKGAVAVLHLLRSCPYIFWSWVREQC